MFIHPYLEYFLDNLHTACSTLLNIFQKTTLLQNKYLIMKKTDLSLLSKRLDEEYEERERRRRETLKKTIESLKTYFKDKHIGKVILVGSVLTEGRFYPFSDIDVAVDGLEEDYFETLTELEEILERDVDLIEMRKCKFKDSLVKKGLKIV